MAVPTVVGTGAASAGTGDITPALPSGIQADDILVLFVESAYGEAVSAPSGWEAAPNSPIESSSGGTRLSVFWKRAGGSESAPTVTDPGDHVIGAIIAFRGVIADKFPFLNTKSGTTAASSSKAILAARTQGIKDVLCVGAISSGADGKTTAQFSSTTGTSLTSITERVDAFTDLGNGGGLGVFTATRASEYYAGSGVTPGWTVSDSSTTSQGAYWSCGLIPSDAPSVFVRGAGDTANGTAAITLAMPDGVRENDILVAFLETANQDITISGWTEAGSSPASNTSGNATRATVFWKRAGASESSVTTSDSGLHQAGFVIAVAGAPTTGDPFQVTGNTTSGSGQSVTIGGITTTSSNTLVLVAAASTGAASYSSWANSNLTDVTASYASGYTNGVSLFGTIGLMHGYKAAAGATGNSTVTLSGSGTSGSWAGWTAAIASGGQTLSAEPGTLTVSSQNAQFNWLFADAGTLSIAGESANINQNRILSADAGTLSAASGDANLPVGYALKADSSNLTATPFEARLLYDIKLQAEPGAIQLFSASNSFIVPTPARSRVEFLIDLVPTPPSDNYQRYTERLRVNGTTVPVSSWRYTETNNAVGGRLELEIADVSQRSLFTYDTSIVFEVGVWNGSGWTYTSLLNTGALQNSQYLIRSEGSGAPSDAFTIVAMSEMEDRLSKAPDRNTVFYNPGRSGQIGFNLPSIRDINGTETSGSQVSIEDMDLHKVLHRVFVTECGFGDFVTNIPNFRIDNVDFDAGVPYAQTVAGLVGVFNPSYSVYRRGGTLVLFLTDGTVARAPGLPSARRITLSSATAAELGTDFAGIPNQFTDENGNPASAVLNIGGLELTVNQTALETDFQSTAERTVTETVRTGEISEDANQYTDQTFVKKYLDHFDSRYGDLPFRSDLIEVSTTTTMTKTATETYFRPTYGVDPETGATLYQGNQQVSEGDTDTYLVETSTERFSYQNGDLVSRWKKTYGQIPMGHPLPGDEGAENTSKVEYVEDTRDSYYPYETRPVSEEFETVLREYHPHVPGRVYIKRREIAIYGLVVVDEIQDQAGRPFRRPALDVARAGNLVDGQHTDWVRISTLVETFSPNADGTVSLSKTESDFLAEQVSYQESKLDDGQIGVNMRTGRQEKVVVYPEGETQLGGQIVRMNAGPLPLSTAVAVGRRRLRLQRRLRQTFSLSLVGIDPTLQRGSLVEAYGRNGELLGTFLVESRTMSGGGSGYASTLEAKTAQT